MFENCVWSLRITNSMHLTFPWCCSKTESVDWCCFNLLSGPVTPLAPHLLRWVNDLVQGRSLWGFLRCLVLVKLLIIWKMKGNIYIFWLKIRSIFFLVHSFCLYTRWQYSVGCFHILIKLLQNPEPSKHQFRSSICISQQPCDFRQTDVVCLILPSLLISTSKNSPWTCTT